MIAYSIRIMLSHVRIKSDTAQKTGIEGHHTELQKLYVKISKEPKPKHQVPNNGSKEPQTSIPNPFVRFQSTSESESEGAETDAAFDLDEVLDEVATCVYKQLQVGESCCIGVMRMSDGAKVPAIRYSHGDEGFIICHWANGETLQTEMPNMFLAPLGEFIMKPQPQEPPKPNAKKESVRKRPAAAALDTTAGEDVDTEQQEPLTGQVAESAPQDLVISCFVNSQV